MSTRTVISFHLPVTGSGSGRSPVLDEPCRTEGFRSPPRPPLRCIGAARGQHEKHNEGDRHDRHTDRPPEQCARIPAPRKTRATATHGEVLVNTNRPAAISAAPAKNMTAARLRY